MDRGQTRHIVFEEEQRSRSVSPAMSNNSHLPGGKEQTGRPTQANSVINETDDSRKRQTQAEKQPSDASSIKDNFLAQIQYAGFTDLQLVALAQLPHWLVKMEDGFYYGPTKSSLPTGQGLFWFNNGDIYIGEWAEGLPHGHGYLYFAEGGFYCGAIDRGFATGYGVFYSQQQDFYYQGLFDAGHLDGRGYLNEGGLAQDCLVKNSKVIFRSTRPISGSRMFELPPSPQTIEEEMTLVSLFTNPETRDQIRQSKAEWQGVYKGSKNQAGQRHGVGHFLTANGSRFHGMFFEEKILGIGVAIDSQGGIKTGVFGPQGLHLYGGSFSLEDSFIGGFRNGKFDGPGVYHARDFGGWILAHFGDQGINCKTYTGQGHLKQSLLQPGPSFLSLVMKKAFGSFRDSNYSIGCSILAARLSSFENHGSEDFLAVMENAYFCKSVTMYLEGQSQASQKRPIFNGMQWEQNSKSSFKNTIAYRNAVFAEWKGYSSQKDPKSTSETQQSPPMLSEHSKSQPQTKQQSQNDSFSFKDSQSSPTKDRVTEDPPQESSFYVIKNETPQRDEGTPGKADSMAATNSKSTALNSGQQPPRHSSQMRQPNFDFLNDF